MMGSFIGDFPIVLSMFWIVSISQHNSNQMFARSFGFDEKDEKAVKDSLDRGLIWNKLFSVICSVSHCVAFLLYKEIFPLSPFFYLIFALGHFAYLIIPNEGKAKEAER